MWRSSLTSPCSISRRRQERADTSSFAIFDSFWGYTICCLNWNRHSSKGGTGPLLIDFLLLSADSSNELDLY